MQRLDQKMEEDRLWRTRTAGCGHINAGLN
jgi:hypothetical protein